jgi:S-adenosylmethionine:tRNA ribosyltransferase-isomerase
MKAAHLPVQRPGDARLLAVDASGCVQDLPRQRITDWLRPGDLLVANDAATMPASLGGVHVRSGAPVELRLAAHDSLAPEAIRPSGPSAGPLPSRPGSWRGIDPHPHWSRGRQFVAVLFGAGDWRTRTEDRPEAPRVQPGDLLALGPLQARVLAILGPPRLLRIEFAGTPDAIWAGLARHGRPVQYAHLALPLALWDVWTSVAAQPVAFEPPSAGFLLDWALLDALHTRGVGFATLTHAAGLSSTGDAALDARLPLPEPYHLPAGTVAAIAQARQRGGRVVAVGTTVTRALEDSAARHGSPRAGMALADLRLGRHTPLRVVDVLVSGTHEPGTSHYELLRAFVPEATLRRISLALDAWAYRTHEYGDSVWLERAHGMGSAPCRPAAAGTVLTASP